MEVGELGIVHRKYWVRSWDCKVCGFTNHRDDPEICVLCYSPRTPNKACSRRVPRRGAKVVTSKSKVTVGRTRG